MNQPGGVTHFMFDAKAACFFSAWPLEFGQRQADERRSFMQTLWR
jgi:hypothetical protein